MEIEAATQDSFQMLGTFSSPQTILQLLNAGKEPRFLELTLKLFASHKNAPDTHPRPLISNNKKAKFHLSLLLRITFGHIIACF